MPPKVEKCVADLMADPKFKPKNPKQTKKDAAWAVCQAAHQEKKMSEDGTIPVGFADEYLLDIITFGERVDYQIVPQLDGTVTIKNLPFFQLGFHKDFPYDQDWANETIKIFKGRKESTGFLPPVFISHEETIEPKPVDGFLNDISQYRDLLLAEITGLSKETAKKYPYRSVEVKPAIHDITGLTLLGAKEIPYFKFAPVQFNENEENKINLTFKDEGGESMPNTFEFAQEDRSLLKGILEGITKFFSTKKPDDPAGEKKTFTEDEVKERENQVKLQTEKAQQVQFAETEKKKDQAEMMKVLFATKDQKEGLFLAPRMRGKVEALFSKLDNLEKVKFSETGADGKDAEKEATAYELAGEIFSELMTKPDAWVALGEKTRYFEATKPAGAEGDKVTMEEAEKTATHVVEKFGTKRKKVEEKK